jgi:hypothetical protein
MFCLWPRMLTSWILIPQDLVGMSLIGGLKPDMTL